MKKTFRTLVSGLLIAGVMFVAVPSADAASILLFDGSSALIIHDNGAVAVPPGNTADQNPILGFVSYSGTIGVFTFTVASGQTKPINGSDESPRMDLVVTALSSAAGTLEVYFSETGFGPTSAYAQTSASGGAGGGLAYETFQDPGNGLFGGALLTTDFSAGGAFSFSDSATLFTTAGPYSLTQKVTIGHTSAAVTTFVGALDVPDGGWAVGLLGFALMGVEGLRRKYPRL